MRPDIAPDARPRPEPLVPGPDRVAYTVPEFCTAHRISRGHLYQLLKDGHGPRIMKVGRRTLISAEAAKDWRSQMEDQVTAGP